MISIALFCKYPQHADTDLRLRPLCLGQGDTGRQGEEPHDRSDDDDDDGITGITSRVISSTGRSRLMLPHASPDSALPVVEMKAALGLASEVRAQGGGGASRSHEILLCLW